MEQPENFEVKSNEGNQEYCKLQENLYGLEQDGCNWCLTFVVGVGVGG